MYFTKPALNSLWKGHSYNSILSLSFSSGLWGGIRSERRTRSMISPRSSRGIMRIGVLEDLLDFHRKIKSNFLCRRFRRSSIGAGTLKKGNESVVTVCADNGQAAIMFFPRPTPSRPQPRLIPAVDAGVKSN